MDREIKLSLINIIYLDLKIINDKPFSMFFNFFLNNSFHIIFWHRISHSLVRTPFKIISRVINAFVRIIYSCDISPFSYIGKNCIIMHGFDIVIGSNVYIGDNTKIFNGVTLGNRKGSHGDGQPTIGRNCMLGTGAKILGNIDIGNDCKIGANSVVLKSFSSGSTVVGNPAISI